mmetsp:Transcript_35943/g.66000  ORF Transcript_35943/g.66000 Transcript_35943/m.66000 type:complete len:111 (-) Transcript_35943:90-422(-)
MQLRFGSALSMLALLLFGSLSSVTARLGEEPAGESEFSSCQHQDIFNIRVCASHQCTECTTQWCADECQEIQKDFPGCRCENWSESRNHFSDSFKHQGLYGDVGDYSKQS